MAFNKRPSLQAALAAAPCCCLLSSMVDESKPAPEIAAASPSLQHRYDWLRWAIRVTGIVLMLAGTCYLGMTAAQLLTSNQSGNEPFLVVCTLIGLGIGMYVLRVGYVMLWSIDERTIRSFSFIFSLVYAFVIAQILPSSGFLSDYPFLLYILLFFFFALFYWLLKTILFQLLMTQKEGSF